jgi:hypothetical protein
MVEDVFDARFGNGGKRPERSHVKQIKRTVNTLPDVG